MTDKTKVMESERFWAIVKKARWLPPFDYKLSGRLLRLELPTWEDAEAFRARFDVSREALCAAIDRFEKQGGERVPVSDDGLSDLTAHVIGLGIVDYIRAIDAPRLLLERAERFDYCESFSYAIPYESSYMVGDQEKRAEGRRRDKVAKDLEKEIENAITAILERGKTLCDLDNSPIRSYVASGMSRAIRNAFPPKKDEEE